MKCYNCEREVSIDRKPGRSDICPLCNSNLHCCFNCNFYDRNAHHECREPQAEWVKEKNSANFCDYFIVRTSGIPLKSVQKNLTKEDAKKKWDDLFKKG